MLVGCKEPVYDKVVGINVNSKFYAETFVAGEDYSLEDYTALITFESTITKTLKLSEICLDNIDTTSVGNKTLTLSYLNKEISIEYEVLPLEVVSLTYKGEMLILFKGEPANLDDVEISALYNNGKDRNVKLRDTEVSEISYSEVGIEKNLSVSYAGSVVEIPYIVKYKPFENNTFYTVVDNVGLYSGERFAKIDLIEMKMRVYTDPVDGGEVRDTKTIYASDNNAFEIRNIFINSESKTIIIYCLGNSVVIENI